MNTIYQTLQKPYKKKITPQKYTEQTLEFKYFLISYKVDIMVFLKPILYF